MAKSFRCQSWCQFGRAESMKVRIGDEKWKETPLRHCGLHNVDESHHHATQVRQSRRCVARFPRTMGALTIS